MCRDAAGGSVAVEIKRRGDIDGVEQLTRYLELLNRDPMLAPVSGVFAAQQIKPQARTLATDRGIRCVVLDYDQLRGSGLRRLQAVLTPCLRRGTEPGVRRRRTRARPGSPSRCTSLGVHRPGALTTSALNRCMATRRNGGLAWTSRSV